MANPSFLSKIKLPMTAKPTMDSGGSSRKTFEDIFNIQNTIRILLRSLVEDAPADGKQYGREDNEWTEIKATAGGGNRRLVYGVYPLPGLIVSNSTQVAPTVNSVTAYVVDSMGLAGNALRVLATSTFSGRIRAGIYAHNLLGSPSVLLQDLGEVVITPTPGTLTGYNFPVLPRNFPTQYCAVVLFFTGAQMSTLLTATVIGFDSSRPVPWTPVPGSKPGFRYTGALTYPATAAPAVLPTMTADASASAFCPAFMYQLPYP